MMSPISQITLANGKLTVTPTLVFITLASAFFGAHGDGFANFWRRLVKSLLHGGKLPCGGEGVKG